MGCVTECVTRKGPKCPESLSYQKNDGRTFPRPPLFQKKKKNQFFFQNNSKKSVSYQKKGGHGHTHARPSFGMTMTQAIRDLFAQRHPLS